ncbi:MAG: carboxypeptidase-like regulatory domain-containing protein [Gemmatimonas sp.]
MNRHPRRSGTVAAIRECRSRLQVQLQRVCEPILCALVALTLLLSAVSETLHAQQSADIIRGRVVGPDSQPVPNVLVTALSYVGGIQKQNRTDKNGRYTIVYPNGEGAYWLQFNLLGFVSRRIEIRRRSDEDVLVADATLSKVQELNAVQVSGAVRLTLSRNDNAQEVSRANQTITTGFVTVAPDARGDLVAQAAGLPGVQLIPGVDGAPDRFSIFGLSGDQNNATLNGLQQGLTKLPREASTTLQLRTGYDVSTGGASGATIAVITNSGTNQKFRPLSVVLSAPQTQLPGALGNRSRYGALSASGRATGPLSWDRSFYNVAFQYDHRQQDLLSLASGANDALQAAGVAADSVPSLLNAFAAAGIPSQSPRSSGRTASNGGAFLGTFDWAPKSAASGHALTLTANGGFQSRGPNALSLLSTASSLSAGSSWNGGLQLRHTNFFGGGTLTESVVSIAMNGTDWRPEFRAPGASVLLTSALDDSTISTRSLLSGGSSTESATRGITAGARNTLSWITSNNRHRVKLTSELNFLSSNQSQQQNSRGTFTYQNTADLLSNSPSAFTRTTGAIDLTAQAMTASLALGDSWRPTTNVQLQYGVRADATRFLSEPDQNDALARALGIRNNRMPNNVRLSPRIGFSKTFIDSYTFTRGTDYEYASDNSTLSGGIGLFQNVRGPDLISESMLQNGLPSAMQTITCLGGATPVPDWQLFAASDAAIPTGCRNGAPAAFSSTIPAVTVFAPGYVEPRSLRASLRYYTERWAQHRTTLAFSYSYNFNQTGISDINLRPDAPFTLAGEGNRAVYVPSSSIDPRSGFASAIDSRRATAFGPVRELRSNLSSQAATFSFSDLRLNFGEPFSVDFGYAYTYNREQFTGYASASRDAFTTGSSRGSVPSHDLNATLRYRFGEVGVLAFFGRLRSGSRFTPMTNGDINGDGNRFNDRAFVFAPTGGADDVIGTDVEHLMAHGSRSARACLRAQVGRIADRNSCATPWNFGSSLLTFAVNPTRVGLPSRVARQFTVANPVGAVDLLLHGSQKARGWGQTPVVDQTLYYVRAFDANRNQFRYEVNQRFGDTQGRSILSQTPAVLTAHVRLDLAPGAQWQQFNQTLLRGRQRTGVKMTESALRASGTPGGAVFPLSLWYLLQVSDKLSLTRVQADSLTRVIYRFNQLIDSAWTPVAKRMATLPADYDERAAHREFVAARDVVFQYWISVMPSVRSLLTRGQFMAMSEVFRNQLFNEHYLRRVQSQFLSFGIMSAP